MLGVLDIFLELVLSLSPHEIYSARVHHFCMHEVICSLLGGLFLGGGFASHVEVRPSPQFDGVEAAEQRNAGLKAIAVKSACKYSIVLFEGFCQLVSLLGVGFVDRSIAA